MAFEQLQRNVDQGYVYWSDRADPASGNWPRPLDAMVTFTPGEVVQVQRPGGVIVSATVVVGIGSAGQTTYPDISLAEENINAVSFSGAWIDAHMDHIVRAVPPGTGFPVTG